MKINKKVLLVAFIVLATVITGILVNTLPLDSYSDKPFIGHFNEETSDIDLEVKNVQRYNEKDKYFYEIDFMFLDNVTERYEDSTLICIYNSNSDSFSSFNINDSEFHVSDMQELDKLHDGDSKKVIDLDLFSR